MLSPRLRLLIVIAALAALFGGIGFFYRGEKPAAGVRRLATQAKSLAAYRKDFPKSDGTLPGDEELAAMLTAKGIPFTSADLPENSGKPAARQLPPVQYESARLSREQKEQIEQVLYDVLPAQLDSLRQISPDVGLLRLVVDQALKLQLHFNAAFARIADDESRLTDFSESLHSLGSTALRGNVIYIDGKPLGVYLSERDRVLNREATAASPAVPGSTK